MAIDILLFSLHQPDAALGDFVLAGRSGRTTFLMYLAVMGTSPASSRIL
jgi:hypothetical protein